MKIKKGILLGTTWFEKKKSKLVVPNSVEIIERYAFYNFMHEKDGTFEIILPSSLKEIRDKAFAFSGFKEIIIPDSVEDIGMEAFIYMNKLKKVKLSSLMTAIPIRSFNECNNLQEVIIPEGISYIGEKAFFRCLKLKNIHFPQSVKTISKNAFYGCKSLTELNFGLNLKEIGQKAFACSGLIDIKLPKGLTKLDVGAFLKCESLESVSIPAGLKSIDRATFKDCINLKNIKIENGVNTIGENAFNGCINLENITIPNSVKKINELSFYNCKNLKNISLSEGIEEIGPKAFGNCVNLKDIKIPSTMKNVANDAFSGCTNLYKIYLSSTTVFAAELDMCPVYISKNGNEFCISKEPINDKSFRYDGKYPGLIVALWDTKDKLLNEVKKNSRIEDLLFYLLGNLGIEKVKEFFKEKQFNNFNVFCRQNPCNFYLAPKDQQNEMYKLLYDLGAFEVDDRKHIAQKVTEFLINEINNGRMGGKLFTYREIKRITQDMKLYKYIPEFTQMFMDKDSFEKLMKEDFKKEGFFAKCYNLFEEVQKTNTSNRGSNRQLKPTVEKFQSYFDANKFINVTPENKHIAEVVGKYYSSQKEFDNALKIAKEKEMAGVSNHILKSDSSEKESLKRLKKEIEKSEALAKNLIFTLDSISKSEFTYEWLAKNDPQNFVLGKLCNCCAHLKGVGYGIMRASIILPNVQNLVIRNKNCEIIAKATLYVNAPQGYGLINTIEINDESVKFSQNEEIYLKIKFAISEFARIFNEENPETPLKIINVGQNNNDLLIELVDDVGTSKRFLTPLNYGHYGTEELSHEGDCFSGQSTIWEKEV